MVLPSEETLSTFRLSHKLPLAEIRLGFEAAYGRSTASIEVQLPMEM